MSKKHHLAWVKNNYTYNTYLSYHVAISSIFKVIDKNTILKKTDPPFWTKYFDKVIPTRTKSTIQQRKAALISMFNYGISHGYLTTNPIRSISLKSKDYSTITTDIENKYLTQNEYNKIIDYARKHRADYADLFEFLYYTGMRIGECSALSPSDIIKKKDKFYVKIDKTLIKTKNGFKPHNHTKTLAGMRTIYLPPKAIQLLKQHI